jgi:hypothetical protein
MDVEVRIYESRQLYVPFLVVMFGIYMANKYLKNVAELKYVVNDSNKSKFCSSRN